MKSIPDSHTDKVHRIHLQNVVVCCAIYRNTRCLAKLINLVMYIVIEHRQQRFDKVLLRQLLSA